MFVVAYAIFVVSYDHWGLSLGWMPSTIVAAAVGRIAYCFPWIVDVVAILLELIGAVIGQAPALGAMVVACRRLGYSSYGTGPC